MYERDICVFMRETDKGPYVKHTCIVYVYVPALYVCIYIYMYVCMYVCSHAAHHALVEMHYHANLL